ncbi:MAG: NAD(+) synthase [Bacteriovorax sp.]|nr:NAD(+) synthase [Bacteriovorax sp.]
MQLNLHQTHHEIGDFEAIFKYLSTTFQGGNLSGLHLFPELFLTGYPLMDLVLQKSFIDDYQAFLSDLSLWSERQFKPSNDACSVLVGGLSYQFDTFGLPSQIENVIYLLEPGKKIRNIYTKQLLPNYDIYEEKKYFTAGSIPAVFKFNDKTIGLLICEDMWFSHLHEIDPVEQLKDHLEGSKLKCDLIINLSASPYHLGKIDSRINRALEISQYLSAPFAYVNRVAAEDEIIFDGRSFVVDGSTVVAMAQAFKNDVLTLKLPTYTQPAKEFTRKLNTTANSWGTIFSSRLTPDTIKLSSLTENECEEVLDAIILGISDYAIKNNINKFTIALSGGMDSSLVLAILKIIKNRDLFPMTIEAVFMPGLFSSSLSYDLAYDLCRNIGVKLTTMPIKFIHSTIKTVYKDSFQAELAGLADENIQSRLRGALIYARSNAMGSMVLNTSNKSELAVGYSTIYGDSVGALSVLGDLYKSEVFELARFINTQYFNIIPEEIISRAPSAELRENQEDSQSLPPYDRLDPILEALLSQRFSVQDLIKKGHNKDEVIKVYQLIVKSEYKRAQFCPIIKLKAKSFGFGYRVPISKKTL